MKDKHTNTTNGRISALDDRANLPPKPSSSGDLETPSRYPSLIEQATTSGALASLAAKSNLYSSLLEKTTTSGALASLAAKSNLYSSLLEKTTASRALASLAAKSNLYSSLLEKTTTSGALASLAAKSNLYSSLLEKTTASRALASLAAKSNLYSSLLEKTTTSGALASFAAKSNLYSSLLEKTTASGALASFAAKSNLYSSLLEKTTASRALASLAAKSNLYSSLLEKTTTSGALASFAAKSEQHSSLMETQRVLAPFVIDELLLEGGGELAASFDEAADIDSWVEEIIAVIVKSLREALSNCKSFIEVSNIITAIGVVISVLALQVAEQSATSEDIEKLNTSVRQGNAIRQETLEVAREKLDVERERLRLEREQLKIERNRADPVNRLLETLELAHQMAADKAATLPPPDLYAVRRTALLNSEQRFGSLPIAVLQPGDVVNVIERAGKWVKAERVSPADGTLQQGWALKKYMERLE